MEIELRYLAHSRSGDKGNLFNVGVFAYDPASYDFLVEQLSIERVHQLYRVAERVDRYLAPNVHGMNFVMHNALAGGVSRTLALDNYGKAMSSAILRLVVDVPEEIARRARETFKAPEHA